MTLFFNYWHPDVYNCHNNNNNFLFSVFPQEPQRANPFSMQDTQRPINKNYRLQNAHNNGFEFTLSTTNDSRRLNEKFTKKQHFVQGRVSLLHSLLCFC